MTTNMINKDENKHNIWFTSDLHFNHDKEFVWKERGFNSVQEMNDKILENLNACISPDDDLYILGDLFLGGKADIEILKSIPGHIHIIAGNHDTPTKIKVYAQEERPIKWHTIISQTQDGATTLYPLGEVYAGDCG